MNELFSELYGTYYHTVTDLLRLAVRGELDEATLRAVVAEQGFGESLLSIPAALKSGRWPLVTEDLRTPLRHEPHRPLTLLEKRWLKAISLDARVRLFDPDLSPLSDVEPLFTPDMVYYYDRYADGDDFEDPGYIERFRVILAAVRERIPIKLELDTRSGRPILVRAMPEYLEYSEKDDKFRLITSGCHFHPIVMLSRVLTVELCPTMTFKQAEPPTARRTSVTFTLFDGRNTLERAMLHFAHFEKTVEKVDENHYTVRLSYDPLDESELIIRILSFGPFIRVTEPQALVQLIKKRLEMQKRCGM